MKKLLLIDGNSLLYKAYHASSFLLNKGIGFDAYGKPVNALRTFAMMMLKLKDDFADHNVLVAFDHKDVFTYRNNYNFYKGGRKKTPEELINQKPLIEKFLCLFG
jgi:DNA polymerase-1